MTHTTNVGAVQAALAKKQAASESEIKIAPAKGRPMLTWVGKRPLSRITPLPAQLVETYAVDAPCVSRTADTWADWPTNYPTGGLLFHGDNKEILAHLLANGFRGRVRLAYIDPPYDSGANYVRKVSLRGSQGASRLEGEAYSVGEQIQYTDIWANDNYLQFMYERLLLLKELLTDDGCIYLHCDPQRGHYLKCMLDEVFGADHFINEIVWKRSDAHSDTGQGAKHLGAIHDTIFLYSRGSKYVWNDVFLPLPASTVEKWYRHVEPGTGRKYNLADVTGPGGAVKGNPVYEWNGITRAWRYSKQRMEELDRLGLLVHTESGMPYQKRYLDESKGIPLQDWWDDIAMIRGIQRQGDAHYPTEKPERLVERIIQVSSNPGDLVLDCFAGSGTTAAVAERLGRRWIGCDINKGAIQMAARRLHSVMKDREASTARPRRPPGVAPTDDESPLAAQSAFSVWRVNDYDLAVQHNEAVNLACEFIGIQRTRTDSFFDGTLGSSLVKIIPFGHPLSILDLEELKRELDARPDEARSITVVCLGTELAAKAWIDEWNGVRSGKSSDHVNRSDVNAIRMIELRSDPKYGGFLKHEPARARVSVTRVVRTDGGQMVVVEIKDFISPTIIKRLEQQAGLLKPQIEDWRAMVDAVTIDMAYNGLVFNVALSDVPERKGDLASGRYELPAPEGEAKVAVKIVDMLGEEVLTLLSV